MCSTIQSAQAFSWVRKLTRSQVQSSCICYFNLYKSYRITQVVFSCVLMYFIYFNAGAPKMGYIPRIGSYYQVVHEAGKFYSSQSHISDINPIKKGFTWKLEHVLGCNWNLELKLQVTELKPDWLVEIAPHYYQMKDVEDRMLSFSLSVSVYLCVCVHVLLKGLNIIVVQAGNEDRTCMPIPVINRYAGKRLPSACYLNGQICRLEWA